MVYAEVIITVSYFRTWWPWCRERTSHQECGQQCIHSPTRTTWQQSWPLKVHRTESKPGSLYYSPHTTVRSY